MQIIHLPVYNVFLFLCCFFSSCLLSTHAASDVHKKGFTVRSDCFCKLFVLIFLAYFAVFKHLYCWELYFSCFLSSDTASMFWNTSFPFEWHQLHRSFTTPAAASSGCDSFRICFYQCYCCALTGMHLLFWKHVQYLQIFYSFSCYFQFSIKELLLVFVILQLTIYQKHFSGDLYVINKIQNLLTDFQIGIRQQNKMKKGKLTGQTFSI